MDHALYMNSLKGVDVSELMVEYLNSRSKDPDCWTWSMLEKIPRNQNSGILVVSNIIMK